VTVTVLLGPDIGIVTIRSFMYFAEYVSADQQNRRIKHFGRSTPNTIIPTSSMTVTKSNDSVDAFLY
jgi:hypothetical protein